MPYLPLKIPDDVLHVQQVRKSPENFLPITQYCIYVLILYVLHLAYRLKIDTDLWRIHCYFTCTIFYCVAVMFDDTVDDDICVSSNIANLVIRKM
jgi:hypothetical protein